MIRTNIRGTFVVDQLAAKRVRDGGASASTNTSTIVAGWSVQVPAAGGPGAESRCLTSIQVGLSAGTHRLAVYGVRTAGSGVITFDSANSSKKEFYVEDLG